MIHETLFFLKFSIEVKIHVGGCPEEGHKNDEMDGTPLLCLE